MTKVISFARVGASAPTPAAPTAPIQSEASVEEVSLNLPPPPAMTTIPTTPQPQALVVPPASSSSSALVAQGSADDIHDGIDPTTDIKLPRLKLLQGTSDKKLLQEFGFTGLILKDSVLIARAANEGQQALTGRLVFVRLISKTYTERVARFGDPSMFARSLQEVDEMGGTTDWRQSKENRKSGSTRPWFQVNANCLVLVEKPEAAADDHFPFETDGKLYCPALYSVKSFAYDRFFAEIATAKLTGELRKDGYSSRFVLFTPEVEVGKGNAEFAVPGVKFGEPTSEALRQLAAQF
jgi:hypothetical protein